ncbi:hypothetical protein HDU98_010421 [Podochytrium sp. JEL0797]|nr:hypothetical protein HDU98_010421 [Podochytrium sp. JEL0797]
MEVILPKIFSELPEKRFSDLSSRSVQMFSVLQSVRTTKFPVDDANALKCQHMLKLIRNHIHMHDEVAAKLSKANQKDRARRDQLEKEYKKGSESSVGK